MTRHIVCWISILCILGTYSTTEAKRKKRLTVYCSAAAIDWCELMVKEFKKETGIRVSMIRKSSGEAAAQIRAERRSPKGDVWWGGTGDPHLQAAEEGLTEAYVSPENKNLYPWALDPHRATEGKTVGVYMGALGIGYNTEILKKKGLPAPKCWSDLTKPIYKDEIQMPNPNSSGTAYTALATFVQLFGEEKGFEYLKKLHKNISQYTKSGSAPIKAAARGEATIGITFMHGVTKLQTVGFPVESVAPCEGTGFEIGSVSIIKNARNPEAAKEWVDFSLSAKVQSMNEAAGAYQIPSNRNAKVPDKAPDVSKIKLIEYDHKKYGSKEMHKHLLDRWNKEVKTLPR